MTPRDAYQKACRLGKPIPSLEPLISTDAEAAFHYAQDVVKGRWKMGEPAILAHPIYCPTYASAVLKERWPAAERAMTDPLACFLYAKMVLKRRWPKKERYIRQDAKMAVSYAFALLKRRWKQAEATIATDELAASKYLPLLKKSWTPAAVKMCPMWMYCYAATHLQGRLPPSLHNRMLAAGLIDSNNTWVRRYFQSKQLQNTTTKAMSRRSVKAAGLHRSKGKA